MKAPVKNTILLVDDFSTLARHYIDIIESVMPKGYKVELAANYDEAIRALKKKNVAMLICDNYLPSPFEDKAPLQDYAKQHHLSEEQIKEREILRNEYENNPGVQIVRLARLMDKTMPILWHSGIANEEKFEKIQKAINAPLKKPYNISYPRVDFDDYTTANDKCDSPTALKDFVQRHLKVPPGYNEATQR